MGWRIDETHLSLYKTGCAALCEFDSLVEFADKYIDLAEKSEAKDTMHKCPIVFFPTKKRSKNIVMYFVYSASHFSHR